MPEDAPPGDVRGKLETLYAVYADFHRRYEADRAAGKEYPVEHYRALFPAHAEAIAEIYGRLRVEEGAVEIASSVEETFERLGAEPPRPVIATEEIARGGMGAILRIRDGLLSRDLAMKIVLGEEGRIDAAAAAAAGRTLAPSSLLRRFLQEARITAQLAHPGVVPVHALGVDGEGRVFFTMKLVHGRTLGEILRLARSREEGWTLTRALQVFLRIGETVGFAHSKGVIHRDLKPANVMVGTFGEVYVMDWGLAKVMGREEAAAPAGEGPVPAAAGPALTVVGTVIGTPEYMPPEQARGWIGALDERSDVYSLGAMLYEMLAGEPPYYDSMGTLPAREVVAKVIAGPPRAIHAIDPTVPPELEAVAQKAMARDPAARYASAAELVEDLHRFLDGRAVLAHGTGPVVELRKWVARNRGVALSLTGLVLVAVAGTAAFGIHQRGARIEIENEKDAAVAARVRADRARGQADGEARRADGLRLSAQSMTTGINDPSLSLLLAVEGAERFQGRDANTALYRALAGHREMKKLLGHDSYLDGACFDPAGTRVLTFDQGGQAILWDAESGERLRSLDEHALGIRAGSFSPDGRRVLTASDDGTARVWDAETGSAVAVLRGHGGPVTAAAFLPGGRRVATASEDGTARVFDAADGREIACFALHGAPVTSVDPSADGSLVVSCGKDGFARVWRTEGAEEVLKVPVREGAGAPEPPDPALPADLSGPGDRAFFMLDGTRLLTSRALREVRLFDARTGEMLDRTGGDGLLHDLLAVSPERAHAVLATRGFKDQAGTVVEFRDLTGRRPAVRMNPGWWPTWAALGPGGRRLLAIPIGYVAFVLDRDTGTVESELRGHAYWVRGGAFSADGRRAVTASSDMSARIWSVEETDDFRARWIDPDGSAVAATTIADDGRTAIRCRPAGADGSISLEIVDARTGETLEPLEVLPGYPDEADFAPGGRRVAISRGGRLRVFDRGTAGPVAEFEVPRHGRILFTPDGTRMALKGDLGLGIVVDIPSRTVLPYRFGNAETHSLNLCWGPDGRTLLSADGGAATASLWEVDTGKLRRKHAGHFAWVIDACFSPDGKRIATTAMDQTVQITDAATGAPVATVAGIPKVEHHLAFHPGGRRLVAYSRWQARVCDADTGEILGMIEAPQEGDHAGDFAQVWFAPGGDALVAQTHGNRILRYPLDPLPYARGRLPRPLDPQERNRYSVGTPEERASFQRQWTLARGRPSDLLAYGLARLRGEDLEGATEAFDAAVRVRPRAPHGPYGLACAHGRRALARPEGSPARAAEVALALDALERAAALGWDRWEPLKQEPLLEALRGDPRYGRLVEGR